MSFSERIWLKNEFLAEKKGETVYWGESCAGFNFFHVFLCFFVFIALYTLVTFFFVLVLALSQKRIIKEIEGLSENGESK